MKSLRIISTKIIIAIVALQLLNVGLYSQNTTLEISPENIINSVTEYFAEIVLKKKDAFPENNNQNQDKHSHDSHTIKTFAIQLFSVPKLSFTLINLAKEINFHQYNEDYTPTYIFEITPPPPKNLV